MTFDQDPNEQANISGADLAILIDELKTTQAQRDDLLSALRVTYDALCVSYPLHTVDMDKRSLVLQQARAAIAKATGE